MELCNHSHESIISLFVGAGPLISKPCISLTTALNLSGAEAIIFTQLSSGSFLQKSVLQNLHQGLPAKKISLELLLHL